MILVILMKLVSDFYMPRIAFKICPLIRTIWIFNVYGIYRIGYGYIDYFLIHIKDLFGFLGTQGLNIYLSNTDFRHPRSFYKSV